VERGGVDALINADLEVVLEEWAFFRQWARRYPPFRDCENMEDAWATLMAAALANTGPAFPNLECLALISFTFFISSADCERIFSLQNWLKGVLRASMNIETLDALLRVREQGTVAGGSAFVDFSCFARAWACAATRRFATTQ
jgi:hypothetical protein